MRTTNHSQASFQVSMAKLMAPASEASARMAKTPLMAMHAEKTQNPAQHASKQNSGKVSLERIVNQIYAAIEQTPTTLKIVKTAGFCSSVERMCCCFRMRP